MPSPYETCFRDEPNVGPSRAVCQELITYEWRGNTLFKVTTKRVFHYNDYIDSQTSEVLYIE